MSKSKKLLAVVIVVVMLTSVMAPVYAVAGASKYTITSPYATVDWDTWGAYKTQLHTHTTYSDSTLTLSETVERYYDLDFDILAITDHGVHGTDWTKRAKMCNLIGYYGLYGNVDTLTPERNLQIATGEDRNGRGMYNLKSGIELNALVIRKNHVNGFFCDYGYDVWGTENDYETAVKENAKAGGLTFLNHLGDWTGGGHDVANNNDPETLQYFADIFKKYPSCVGMEIINEIDTTTRNDRVLWDNLLKIVIPSGRNIWGFSNDDAHEMKNIGISFETFMLPSVSDETIRTAMENGTFFSVGRRARAELGEQFFGGYETPYPVVTKIDVDDDTDTISVEAEDYDKIQWVSEGKIIAEGNEINLNDYADEIGCYVRFQLINNEGGMTFSNPFVVDDGTLSETNNDVYTAPEYPEIIQLLLDFFRILKNTKIGALIHKISN